MNNSEKLRVVFWAIVAAAALFFVLDARAEPEDSGAVNVYHLLKSHRMSNGFHECTWSHDLCASIITRA